VEIYRKWICIICVIELSGSMLGSMPKVVQQAEIPFFTLSRTTARESRPKSFLLLHDVGYEAGYMLRAFVIPKCPN